MFRPAPLAISTILCGPKSSKTFYFRTAFHPRRFYYKLCTQRFSVRYSACEGVKRKTPCGFEAEHNTSMGCGRSVPVHTATGGGSETDELQGIVPGAHAPPISDHVYPSSKQTQAVTLPGQLASTRSELANAGTGELVATGSDSFVCKDNNERLFERQVGEYTPHVCPLGTPSLAPAPQRPGLSDYKTDVSMVHDNTSIQFAMPHKPGKGSDNVLVDSAVPVSDSKPKPAKHVAAISSASGKPQTEPMFTCPSRWNGPGPKFGPNGAKFIVSSGPMFESSKRF